MMKASAGIRPACHARREAAMIESVRFLPLLGRILIAVLFLPAGFEKLTGFQGAVQYATSAGMPLPALGIA
ncbi:MAG TPA: DoxX family protein, partial [Candidatus Binatia bacterium]|nr:DoxX family protein [Candidatus Binatia bacterium]